MSDNTRANHLINENSPYLLQHARNPVEWYPWGTEALEKAKQENKMLLISIGYAACHWCHVMAHESFEDNEVAAIMNRYFINIKVDREERPDIDDIYMTACQLSNGRNCGWPLNAFALPDGRPVWAGTYFQKNQWINILGQFNHFQENEPDRLIEAANSIMNGMRQLDQMVRDEENSVFTQHEIQRLHDGFLQQIDQKNGGRKGAPKFPLPNNYEFLLEYHHYFRDSESLEVVNLTLEKMAFGGIYDQIGGGFARYSVDEVWFIPHFEKMLYDNAQLVALYSKAFQQTGDMLYKEVIEKTLDFIDRELTGPEGGFYSSLDADSEGVEGLYYTWTWQELSEIIINEKELEIYCDFYHIKNNGNWEDGRNILYREDRIRVFSQKKGISETSVRKLIDHYNELLLSKRAVRIRPGLDDKILTSWNGLMMYGYVQAYRALGNVLYLEKAISCGQYIKDKMMKNDFRLYRSYKDGKRKINAFLDDYANTIQGFLALYETTFQIEWLETAKGLTNYAINHFYEPGTNKFYYTSKLDPALVTRKTELTDNVIPGSVSMMCKNLIRLSHISSEINYHEVAVNIFSAMTPTLQKINQASYYSNWLSVALLLSFPPKEVVVLGKHANEVRDQLLRQYLPNIVLLGGIEENSLPNTQNRLVKGKTMIYVCQDKVCQKPVESLEDALILLKGIEL